MDVQGRAGVGRRRAMAVTIVVTGAGLALPAAASAVGPQARLRAATPAVAKPYFDSRVGARRAVETARSVQRLDGALTGPAAGDRADVAMRWVRAHRTALGLTAADVDDLPLPDRAVDRGSGFTYLRFRQSYRGIPAFDGGLRVNLDRGGRILNVTGAPVSGLTVPSVTPRLSGREALRALQDDVGVRRSIDVRSGPAGARRVTRFAPGDFARLVLFDGANGTRLAWHVLYRANSLALYDAVVDATTGKVLFRQNLTRFDADQSVFPNYPGAERDPDPDKASANVKRQVNLETRGWLLNTATTLTGPNAHVWSDVDDDDAVGAGEEIARAGTNADFDDMFTPFQQPGNACDFTLAPNGWPDAIGKTADCSWNPDDRDSWVTNREQNGVQAFYLVNEFHDHLRSAPIGFNAASGNFEGTDPVDVNADDGADTDGSGGPDGAHVNNASMSTPPDGDSPRMQMYLFEHDPSADFSFRNINGGDDASTVWHEYTHGLSNRLITYADGSGATASPHAGAMGEAWSDWYALDLLHRRGLEIDEPGPGQVDIGVYSDATFASTRFEPADCRPEDDADPRCPGGVSTGPGGFTFGDFGKVSVGPEVHSDGEIWMQTLWDLRTALVAALGQQQGSDEAERLITQGMRLSPPEPSFLDMRNAILAAEAGAGNAYRTLIWRAFADRGMGYFAAVTGSSDTTPTEDFTVPPNTLPSGVLHASKARVNPGEPVLFGASFTDPDSTIAGYRWDFDGNGTIDRTTGTATTSFAYARSGDYTARVQVVDSRGGAGTGAVALHVTRAPRVGALPRRGTNGRLRVKVACDVRCTATAKLTLSNKLARRLGLKNKRTVGSVKRTIAAGASKRLTVKLSSKAKRALKRHRRRSVKATLTVTARDAGGRRRSARRTVTIRV
jgi:extracellular elastinolytic metalloproteinase